MFVKKAHKLYLSNTEIKLRFCSPDMDFICISPGQVIFRSGEAALEFGCRIVQLTDWSLKS